MTRKDYIAIAKMIHATINSFDNGDRAEIGAEMAARNIADVMQQDNARFDRARFLKACGIAA